MAVRASSPQPGKNCPSPTSDRVTRTAYHDNDEAPIWSRTSPAIARNSKRGVGEGFVISMLTARVSRWLAKHIGARATAGCVAHDLPLPQSRQMLCPDHIPHLQPPHATLHVTRSSSTYGVHKHLIFQPGDVDSNLDGSVWSWNAGARTEACLALDSFRPLAHVGAIRNAVHKL